MKTLNCEYVREVYPDVLHGAAAADTATAVRAHLATCGDCRAEAALMDALFANGLAVPAGLEARVTGALAGAPAARGSGPRRLAIAATMAATLIGGAVLWQANRAVTTGPAPATEAGGLGFVTVEAAMMSGTGSLQDLTVEELEQLLGEIES